MLFHICGFTGVSSSHLLLFWYELQAGWAKESACVQVDLSHLNCTWEQSFRMGHVYQLCWPCITPSYYLLYLFPLAHYDMI